MKDDFFSGIFDFNQDGKTDLSEQFLAFMMMQELMADEEDEDGQYSFEGSDANERYGW